MRLSMTVRRIAIALYVLAFFAFATVPALSQIAPTNSVTVGGSVVDAVGKPVAGAKVSLSGPKSQSTKTDAQGQFAFVGFPFGQYTITVVDPNLGTLSQSVTVDGDINVAIAYKSADNLKVIGSVSAVGSGTFNVTPASITQVNPMTQAFEGKTTWRTIMESIPGVSQGGLLNGNIQFGNIPNGPLVPTQISINGTLPYESAVLFDDMPLVGGSTATGNVTSDRPGTGTNLGNYSLNSFTSSDVIRGPGANSPSIVDSIGGSFVLRAPGAVRTNHTEFSLSTDAYGGAIANALVANRWNNLSTTFTYGFWNTNGPFPGQYAVPFGPPGLSGIMTVNGRQFVPSTTACAVPTCQSNSLINPNYNAAGSATSFATAGTQTAVVVCCVAAPSSAWSQHSGSLTLNYALSPGLSATFYYSGARTSASNPPQEVALNFLPQSTYGGTFPTGLSTQLFSRIDRWVYEPQSSSLIEEKLAGSIGRGVFKVAALQNTSWDPATTYPLDGTANGVFVYGTGNLCSNTSTNCSTGTLVPTTFNGGTPMTVQTSINVISTPYTVRNRDLLFSYATPIGENFRAGASFVKSLYNIEQGITDLAYTPFGTQTISEVVPQFMLPGENLTTTEARIFAGVNPTPKTSFDLSWYFANADYHIPDPNGGSSVTSITTSNGLTTVTISPPTAYIDAKFAYSAPRLGFVWRPSPSVAIRASAGGGFAEAPLGQLIGSNNPLPTCTATSCAVSLTNTGLQPETSWAYTAGTDLRLDPATVLSFDFYRANLHGQQYSSTSLSNAACATCNGLPLFVTEVGNLGASRYEGVTLDLRRNVPQGIYWKFSAGLTRGYVVGVPDGFYNVANATCNMTTGANCKNTTVIPGINFNGTFAASIPYSSGLGSFGYRWSPERFINFQTVYYGNNNTYFRPAFFVYNADLGLPLGKNVSVQASVLNIGGAWDTPTQILSPDNIMVGAPQIGFKPVGLYGEMYSPRTVTLTMHVHL